MLLTALLALAPALPQDAAPPELQAVLALSIDAGFTDEWAHSSSSHGLQISAAGAVVRGQPFQVFAFAVGFGKGPKERVDLRYDLKVARPDGTTYLEKQGLEMRTGEGTPLGVVLLAKQGLGVSFDPPDPKGEYTFTMVLHDGVSKANATSEARIELIDFPEPEPFADADALSDWAMEYHKSPSPCRALDALARAGPDGLLGGSERNYVLCTFVATLLRDHAFLQPRLLERFLKFEPAARLAALEALAVAGTDAKPILALVSKEEGEAYERWRKAARPDPLEGPIRDAGQLDELWGTFFATGRFAPIEHLAKALVLDEKSKVLEEVARWSLKSNLRFPRVRTYCEWMLENGKLEEKDAEMLKELLKG